MIRWLKLNFIFCCDIHLTIINTRVTLLTMIGLCLLVWVIEEVAYLAKVQWKLNIAALTILRWFLNFKTVETSDFLGVESAHFMPRFFATFDQKFEVFCFVMAVSASEELLALFTANLGSSSVVSAAISVNLCHVRFVIVKLLSVYTDAAWVAHW